MTKTTLTADNISEFLNELPFHEFKALVENYAKHTKTSLNKEMKQLVTADLQNRLEKLGINSVCPECGCADIARNGKRSTGIQKYKCRNCKHEFSLFSGTIFI